MPQNNNELLQELIEKYAKMYMKMAYNRGVPYDDAEDVVMEAFWSFYKSEYFGKLSEEETKIMLAHILKNKCIDYYRKNSRMELVGMDECEAELDRLSGRSENALENNMIENEDYRRIREAIEGMKEIWRDAAIMYFIEERSTAEICKALGISEMVCRSRISRARKYLKEKLKDLWEKT